MLQSSLFVSHLIQEVLSYMIVKNQKRVWGIPLDTVNSILLYKCLHRVMTIDLIHIALSQTKYSIAYQTLLSNNISLQLSMWFSNRRKNTWWINACSRTRRTGEDCDEEMSRILLKEYPFLRIIKQWYIGTNNSCEVSLILTIIYSWEGSRMSWYWKIALFQRLFGGTDESYTCT